MTVKMKGFFCLSRTCQKTDSQDCPQPTEAEAGDETCRTKPLTHNKQLHVTSNGSYRQSTELEEKNKIPKNHKQTTRTRNTLGKE